MKKSKVVALVIITAALASCHKKGPIDPNEKRVFMRGDSTAGYTQTPYHHHNGFMWYYAFRPYGSYYNGSYHHAGYYSGGIHESSNIGHSTVKSGIVRGGFGGSSHSFSVSS